MPDFSSILNFAASVGNKSGAIPAAPQGLMMLKESIEGLPFEILTKSMSGILDQAKVLAGIQQLAGQLGGLENLGNVQSIIGDITNGVASVDQIVSAVGGVTAMSAGLSSFLPPEAKAVIDAVSPGTVK